MLGRKMVLWAGFLGMAALALVAMRVFAFPDRPKEVIESPVKEAVAKAAGNVRPNAGAPAKAKGPKLDVGKRVIERKAEDLLGTATGVAQPIAQPVAGRDNPKVQPGKVRWHANFEAARIAAAKSGKPVLLFHLMGKLDDQFC